MAAEALKCPWHNKKPPVYAVGLFAREQGALTPGRLVVSAKSWLCHSGVDRTASLLPWHGADDVGRLSPVEVSSRYIEHVREAWDARFPNEPLAQQDFVLTLPASFDEVARELTVKAAAMAGLPRIFLIEEPQAAFYAWIDAHADNWETMVQPGQKILICDIGGGTTDFTLIRVRRGQGGKVQFHRVAVGDHLILGGDNFDLALAHFVEQKINARDGGKLEPRQWAVLVRICRAVKETLLGPNPPEQMTVNLPGSGKKLIGGGVHIEVTRDEVQQLLIEGFCPRVRLDEKPQGRRSGFQEFGLPFAPDHAITRYLAAFLTAHRDVARDQEEGPIDYDPARPDIVLFNGGAFESPLLRERLLEVLGSWFNEPYSPEGQPATDKNAKQPAAAWKPLVLDNERLDLAVARGAAYYGMVRRGEGVRIAAGLARTYYIGVETVAENIAEPSVEPVEAAIENTESTTESTAENTSENDTKTTPPNRVSTLAVCLLPAGIEPGNDIALTSRQFKLLVSEPVEFPLFVSSTRLTDKPGEIVPIDRERMTPLPPIRTVLRTRKKDDGEVVDVMLHARLTEIGTLDLWCSEVGGRRSWRLQFDVRSTTQTDMTAHESQAEGEGFVDEASWQACATLIQQSFGPDGEEKPERIMKRLATAMSMSRNLWPSSLCRRIWEALMEVEEGRRRSPAHEARWLNLLGFALRPGYGLAMDDWRVAQTWTALQGKFAHPSAMVRVEGWILWRRIGGGLAAGQQQALADPLLGPVRSLHRQLTSGKGRSEFSFPMQETTEMWRLLGSLELLTPETKVELGNMLLDILPKKKMEPVQLAVLWAIGRLGARAPMYGPLNTVVPANTASQWLERIFAMRNDDPACQLAVMQLARRTDDRYRDLPERLRKEAVDWLTVNDSPRHFLELVRDGGRLDDEEEGLVFGESLPKGLQLA
jgi:molecular chaperone DnaK (HSP70)